ncbi:hypothetical protein MMC28_010137 [Mycoblastus sanguinarius]|nr:hypothetical protein [Mycoblastus sanguinarius]
MSETPRPSSDTIFNNVVHSDAAASSQSIATLGNANENPKSAAVSKIFFDGGPSIVISMLHRLNGDLSGTYGFRHVWLEAPGRDGFGIDKNTNGHGIIDDPGGFGIDLTIHQEYGWVEPIRRSTCEFMVQADWDHHKGVDTITDLSRTHL